MDQDVANLALDGKLAEAIKAYRMIHRVGLKEAKDAVIDWILAEVNGENARQARTAHSEGLAQEYEEAMAGQALLNDGNPIGVEYEEAMAAQDLLEE